MHRLTVLVSLLFHSICIIHSIIINENNIVAFPQKVNNDEAFRICKSEGMKLIRIEDEASNEIVYNFAVKYGLGPFWIDGNDKAQEGTWKYSDGKNIMYSKWDINEPNNAQNEDCIHIFWNKTRLWNDVSCNAKMDVICYGEPTVRFTNNQLVFLPGRKSYQQAVRECESRGYNLVKIQNEDMNQMVYEFAKNNHVGQYWIDGNDKGNEGQWVYDDGKSLVYEKWHTDEPNNYRNEDCINGLFYDNEYWNDISCTNENSVICYAAMIIGEYMVAFPRKVDYFEALRVCNLEGMNLLQILNKETNDKVYDFVVNNDLGKFWIDGKYVEIEDKWVYSNGRELIYSKWQEAKSKSFEDNNCIQGLFYQNSFWHKTSCISKNTVICEGDSALSYTENNLVYLKEKATYHQARSLCRAQGLYLVKVFNDNINQMIYSFAVRKNIGKYWIDVNDIEVEGNWVNSDGQNVIYSKWYDNEPNDYQNEDCVLGLYYPNGYWNDISCDSLHSVICYGGAKVN